MSLSWSWLGLFADGPGKKVQAVQTTDINGNIVYLQVGVMAPYPLTPLSPGQHNLAITSATGLTIPSGATMGIVQAFGGTVKYTTDGSTTPTSSVGMTLTAPASITLTGGQIANFKAISASATLDVEYFF